MTCFGLPASYLAARNDEPLDLIHCPFLKLTALGFAPYCSVPVFHYAGLHLALLLTPLRGYQTLIRGIVADNHNK
jgi:hypothetical protein